MNVNLRERKILTYQDIKMVAPGNSDEPLVDVRRYDASIIAEPEQSEMLQYAGDKILVRDCLARKIADANALLGKSFNLRVVFGYRHPDIQRQYFAREQNKIAAQNPKLSDEKINALTHNLIAVPEVAGHTMGAAVDLTITDQDGIPLDMGTKISEFSRTELLPTFAPDISSKQLKNRLALHDAMVAVGFAPFYGEWWHFSYGDREWAAFYGENRAIYGEISIKVIK
jgi:D-alanyl-D-alanine dipeptidase